MIAAESRDFWRTVDEHDGPGVLLLATMESYRSVGEHIGIAGFDFSWAAFYGLCWSVTRSAATQAWVAGTVFAAYWPTDGQSEVSGDEPGRAMDRLARWLPLELVRAGKPEDPSAARVPVVGWQTALQRSRGESGAEIYRRAQLELAGRFDSLPERPKLGEPGRGPATLEANWDVLIGVHPAEVWNIAAERLRELAGDFAEHDSYPGAGIYFVDDARVRYDRGSQIHVRRKDLFPLDADHRWAEFLCPRPRWLHFNLLPNVEGLSIVTLSRSTATMPDDDRGPIAINVGATLSPDDPRPRPKELSDATRRATALEPPLEEVRPGEIRGLRRASPARRLE